MTDKNDTKNSEDDLPESRQMREITRWLKKVRFKKTVFGGVDEQDVWKKINELDSLYQAALMAERVRYDTLLGLEEKHE